MGKSATASAKVMEARPPWSRLSTCCRSAASVTICLLFLWGSERMFYLYVSFRTPKSDKFVQILSRFAQNRREAGHQFEGRRHIPQRPKSVRTSITERRDRSGPYRVAAYHG